ncbi:MAG: HD domain-containing protein [Lachnospiraceae bacterium]|nr:HD domain-containing protein [Lachnospiraceae bacterium]
MNDSTYALLEQYMLSCMTDSAHDKEHIYRVLYTALDIAGTEQDVDYDVLICACLLHDIGRQEQFEDPSLNHAEVGADKAFTFLSKHGFSEAFTHRVCDCIRSHRYRKRNPPSSIEAKILFDADKLDVCGAIGIARTLLYKGIVGEPLYSLTPDGTLLDGTNDTEPSFFQEYKYKLESIYDHFFTERGAALGKERQDTAKNYYQNLLSEMRAVYEDNAAKLATHLSRND